MRFREPEPSLVGREYWERCRRHELACQKCDTCGELRRYLTRVCPNCRSTEYSWVTLSGRGVVYASTVCHYPLTDEFTAPYVLALIDLEENVRMMSNVVGCDPETVHPGMPVTVTFERVSDTITLPLFTPRGEHGVAG